MEALVALDIQIFALVNGRITHPFLDWLAPFLSDFRNFQALLLIAIAAVMWWGSPRARWTIGLAALAVVLADMIGMDIKLLIERYRPFLALDEGEFRLVGTRGSRRVSYAFPSNHAANMFAATTVLAVGFRRQIGKWLPLLFIPAVLVGWSRVYMGVHFPADALAGAVLGIATALGLLALDRRFPVFAFPRERGEPTRINWFSLTLLAAVFIFAYRYSIIGRGVYPLASEEAQYWDWSRRLDWSYYSKPPMIAYLIRLFTEIGGSSAFVIRSVAVTCSLAAAIMSWFFVKDLFRSDRTAFLALAVMMAMPLYAVGAIVLTTDAPLMLLWAAFCYTAWLAISRDRPALWYLAGLWFGLGMLSKYAMIYLLPCLLLFFVLSAEHRHHLRRREFHLGALLALLLMLPIFYWNWSNDWLTFRHVAGNADLDEGFRINLGWVFEYIGSQAGLVTPVFFGAMLWFTWSVFRKDGWQADVRAKYLVALGAPVFLFLLLKSFQGRVYGNWAAPAYYTWAIFAAWQAELLLQRTTRPKARRWLYATAAVGFALPIAGVAVLYDRDAYKSLRGTARSLGIRIPPQADPGYQLLGWDKMGEWVSQALGEMPNPERTFLFTERYHVASEMAFYVEGQPRTYSITFGGRMNQYDVWGPPEGKEGWDAIYVNYREIYALRRAIREEFEHIGLPEFLVIREGGEDYRTFTMFRLYNFSGAFDPEEMAATSY